MGVPKLRFKEFNEDWEVHLLGDLADVTTGDKDTQDKVNNGIYPFFVRSQTVERINSFKQDVEAILTSGDGVGVGKNFHYINGKFDYHQRVYCISNFKNKVIGKYIYFYFSEKFNKRVMGLSAKNSVDSVRRSMITEMSINIPSLKEQIKIANFLTTIDEKITKLTQKSDLLAQYKKSVMQKIFSQELRFKDDDGGEFPEWDFLELEKVAAKVKKKNKDTTISNVLTNSATQGIISQSDYFDRDIANQNNLGGYYIVETDDFVYNPRISANALVGPIKRNHLTVGVMSPLYTVFRFTKGNLDFNERYFQTNHWHDYMKSISNTGARHDRMNITNESFFGLPLPSPVEAEQSKIASFLTAIDNKITRTQGELGAVKQYKQGLLQQMFV